MLMHEPITYPLRITLDLSPLTSATYEGPEGHVHVDGLHAWFIDGELQQHGTVCEEMEEYEWCFWYLKVRGVPLEHGWPPEPFVLFFDEEE